MWPISSFKLVELIFPKVHSNCFLRLKWSFTICGFDFNKVKTSFSGLSTLNLVVSTTNPPVWLIFVSTSVTYIGLDIINHTISTYIPHLLINDAHKCIPTDLSNVAEIVISCIWPVVFCLNLSSAVFDTSNLHHLITTIFHSSAVVHNLAVQQHKSFFYNLAVGSNNFADQSVDRFAEQSQLLRMIPEVQVSICIQ